MMTGTSVKVAVSGDRVLVIPTSDGVHETAEAQEHSMSHGRDMMRDCHENAVAVGVEDKKRKALAVACPSHSFHPRNYLLKGGQRAFDKDLQNRWNAYKDNTISVGSGVRHTGDGISNDAGSGNGERGIGKRAPSTENGSKNGHSTIAGIWTLIVREALCDAGKSTV